VEAIKVFKLVF
jgi:condensin complex subunit 1